MLNGSVFLIMDILPAKRPPKIGNSLNFPNINAVNSVTLSNVNLNFLPNFNKYISVLLLCSNKNFKS